MGSSYLKDIPRLLFLFASIGRVFVHEVKFSTVDYTTEGLDEVDLDPDPPSLPAVQQEGHHPSSNRSFPITEQLTVKGFTPPEDEFYACTKFNLNQSGYVFEFEPVSDLKRVHHMLIYGCSQATDAHGRTDNCGGGCSSILYAWARNAPALLFPPDVGVPVGPLHGTPAIMVQLHYGKKFKGKTLDYSGVILKMVEDQPKYLAGIHLFASGVNIPAGDEDFRINMSCSYRSQSVVWPFAFRTHAHGISKVISAFRLREGKWKMIGKGNPQWPQMFYPVKEPLDIKPGDIMAAQCVYNASSREETTQMGMHGMDEMCNFYMYYYELAKDFLSRSYLECGYGDIPDNLFESYPPEGSTAMPPNPTLDARGHLELKSYGVTEVPNWPPGIQFGQIAGLAIDNKGNVVVFHRATRVWTGSEFDLQHKYLRKADGPIMEQTIFVLDAASGAVLSRWGGGMFYMPHGIHVDSDGNVWVTDVALHQVFKLSPATPDEPLLLEMGIEFRPGDDEKHFCMPAAVTTLQDGSVFVADGYCNSRVVRLNKDGEFVAAYGQLSTSFLADGFPPLGTFNLPHDITADAGRNQLYVADRQNARIQVLDARNGSFLHQIHPPAFGSSIYAVSFSKAADTLFAVNGGGSRDLRVFAIKPDSRTLLYSWGPTSASFARPHALAVSHDGSSVFVGEIGPNILWKFNNTMATKKSGGGSKAKPGVASEGGSITVVQQESSAQLILIISAAVAIPLLLILLICLCIKFKKQGGFRRMNAARHFDMAYRKGGGKGKDNGRVPLLNGMWGRDHKGFQPLSTEDIDAIDDITDESDNEDTLYPVPPQNSQNNHSPLKA